MTTFKKLSSYIDEPITELHNKYGAFWAFSKSQFEESAKENINYVVFWGACYCDKNTVKQFVYEYNEIHRKAKELFLNENNKEDIIKYELSNYECYYTGDISEAYEVLKSYNFTIDEVREVYRKELQNMDDF